MKIIKKIELQIASVVLGVLSHLAFAGEMTSSGGEFITDELNPWFIGNETVNYCIMKDPRYFSLDKQKAIILIDEAIRDWINTLKKLQPEKTRFRLPDGKRKNLTLSFQRQDSCESNTDLKFYLGLNIKSVDRFLLGRYSKYTTALAGRLDYNIKTGRGRGLIWLVPDGGDHKYLGPKHTESFWSDEATFYNVIMHELGHVFGFHHVGENAFYLMNRDFPADVVNTRIPIKISSSYYLNYNWRDSDITACTPLSVEEGYEIRRLLDTPLLTGWRFCLKTSTNSYGLKEFSIEFTSKSGSEKHHFDLLKKSELVSFQGEDSIAGKYYKEKINTNFSLQKHFFVALKSHKLYFLVEGLNASLFVTSSRSRIELLFFKDLEFYKIYLTLGSE